jgi:hypothetical protein
MKTLDDFPYWHDGEPKDDASCSCRHCDWKGTYKDTKIKRVHSSPEEWQALAGRSGYEYHCPRCGFIITAWYWEIS